MGAARIVKAVNALERMLLVGKEVEKQKKISDRAAALVYRPENNKSFEQIKSEYSDIYGLRSDLVHGTASPFEAEVIDSVEKILKSIAFVLCNALGFFEDQGIIEVPLTKMQLKNVYERLVAHARLQSHTS